MRIPGLARAVLARRPRLPEKVLAAEHDLAAVRLAVIVLNVAAYWLALPHAGTWPELAALISVLALAYGGLVVAVRPYRRFPLLASSYFTTGADALLITLWLLATGGGDSPFYLLWFLSLAAVAYRFGSTATLLATWLYAASYGSLLFALGQLPLHATDLALRLGYMGLVGLVASFTARESTRAAEGKVAMRDLAEASRELGSATEMEPALVQVVASAMRLAQADRAAVDLLDAGGGELRCAHAHGLSPAYVEARRAAFRDLPGWSTAERGEVVHVHDALADPRLEALRDVVRAEGIRTFLVLPLRREGRPFGVLTLYRDRVRPFSADEVDAARSFADHAAIAIEHARVLRELRDALSLQHATLESTADGLLVVDLGGRITAFNRRFVEMWGIGPDVLATRDTERVRASILGKLLDPGAFLARTKEMYARPTEETFDLIALRDGRTFERYSIPQRLGGQPVGRVLSFRDVTERRRAEEERVASLERAKELERLQGLDAFKSRFLNTAAHELGTPLTPIKTQLFLLRSSPHLGPQQRKSLDILHRNVDRLAQLVTDVLEAARAQAGRMPLRPGATDIDLLVRDAAESFDEPARLAGIELAVRLGGAGEVRADAKRITQVLFNLLSNALKFTPLGGRIEVRTLREGDGVRIEVEDSGRGLDAASIARLFQPFTQVHDPMEETRPGTGLGLYISRSLVELHGGRIGCDSRGRGQGSTFWFTLPAAGPRAEDVAPRPAAPWQGGPGSA